MRNKTETGNRNTKEAKTVQPNNKRALGRGLEMLTQLSTFDLPQPHSVDRQNLRNTDSSPSGEVPIAENNSNTEAATIEVNIYNVCYTVKSPDNVRFAPNAVPVNAGAVNVNPAIVAFVDPDAIDVLPIVGAE